MKVCSDCGETKPLWEFHVRRASPDGLAYKCKACVNANSERWREENPGAHAAWYRENRARKATYFRRGRQIHRDTEPSRMVAWARKNPHKVNANIAKRVAAKRNAIPVWADMKAITAIYAQAARMRAETGVRYEVDHIVPLQGKTVCGLHCEANLQILPKELNISKLNRSWPGMP